jgi:hypothetical protein
MYKGKVPNLTFRSTNLKEFKAGNIKSDHHMVFIVLTRHTTQERLDQNAEMLACYATAPMTYCFINQTIVNAVTLPGEISNLIMDEKPIACATLQEVIPSVTKMLTQAKDTCKLFEEGEIRPAFLKYDNDGNGSIDVQELGNCLKDLGYELDENDIQAAFKSLDANGDGTIDYNEFRTWYLNGQKGFSKVRQMFTKFAGSLGFLSERSDEISTALKASKKMKKQRVQVSFNAPEFPKDNIQARFSIMGKEHDAWMA